MSTHLWIVGQRPVHDDPASEDPARGHYTDLDCHRRLRGPYTGVGTLLRALVPRAGRDCPDLTRAHAFEILSIAPELADLVDAPPQTLTELAGKDERTRLYTRVHTRRLAHGVIDLLVSWAEAGDAGPLRLAFADVDEADPTDQEFLALLLRRARPRLIRATVHTRVADLPPELAAALRDHAERSDRAPVRAAARPRDPGELLRAYIESDGVAEDPAQLAAYQNADPELRRALHDARAAVLRARPDRTLRLGAIPYHLEHGNDGAEAVRALREALDYCLFRGFYEAVADYGHRVRAIVGPDIATDDYWYPSARMGMAYSVLGRAEEAEAIDRGVRRGCTEPIAHMVTGYALAMMYTRHFPPERRDHDVAREYINNAIAIASLLPDPVESAFHTVFMRNGLALVEMHAGNLKEALRLVTDGLARLGRDLEPGAQRLHRSVLVHNRANVLARLGRLGVSLADFDTVIGLDPHYAEYRVDRAGIRRRLGDTAGALADYDAAVALALPFWELHSNRAAVRAQEGDLEGAVADFTRVVDLEPGELDPWISLVSLLLEVGDLARAQSAIDDGLRHHPGDPQLVCARGQLALQAGRAEQAWRDFAAALDGDGTMVAALAGRATIAYERGDHDAALDDLTRAIGAEADDPDLLYNRAQVHQAAGHRGAAVDDYTRALDLPGADRAELLLQRGLCYAEIGDVKASRADLDKAARLRRQAEPASTP
jgi:tetratricopeptide (TPR) repeat protein